MAEGTYEHACMRAELLGLEKPNEDDFLKHRVPSGLDIEENTEAAQFEDISLQNEDLDRAKGGLNELNSILTGTQRKINKLKGIYGSFSDLIKNKLGGSKDDMSYSTHPNYVPGDTAGGSKSNVTNVDTSDSNQSAIDSKTEGKKELHQQIFSQVDKLDSLLDKAENAQYTMQSQNKQMKRFLQK